MKIGLIGGLLLVPAGIYGQTKMESPNIVIIEADDLGFGDLSCYGATAIQTSGMDRLANEGLRFTDAYCTAATSTPSRYSLLTGMYPWSNPQAKILPGNAALIIDTHRITLPKMMRSAGYVTGAVGKWHLGLGDGAVDWNQPIYPGAKEVGYDYSFIQAATNDRVPNERFVGKSGMGPRGDVILEADWCVEEFLKELDRLNLTDNTLVILTSDNGPVLDDGYQDQAEELVGSHKPAGPYRGWKTMRYAGGTCIPFIVRWPGVVEPGVSDAFVCQMDLLASLASLVGQSYPDRTDSQNTLQTFLGKNRKGRNELVIEGMLDYAYRQGDWVMIPPYPGENRTYELYNIRKDPEQKNDLSESEPKVLRRMMMRFEELKRETDKKTNF